MGSQLTFDELRRSRATDPQTSQDAARRANGIFYHFAELLQMHMSGDNIYIRIDNGNKRFVEIFVLQTCGAQ